MKSHTFTECSLFKDFSIKIQLDDDSINKKKKKKYENQCNSNIKCLLLNDYSTGNTNYKNILQ